jgi:hypothetical protein
LDADKAAIGIWVVTYVASTASFLNVFTFTSIYNIIAGWRQHQEDQKKHVRPKKKGWNLFPGFPLGRVSHADVP